MRRRWLTLIIIVLIYESMSKGWVSLLLFPALVVVLPILIALYKIVNRRLITGTNNTQRGLLWLSALSVVVAYIFTVGGGDTSDALLFGFYSAQANDMITTVSNIISSVAFVVTPVATLSLITYLFITRPRATAMVRS